jgi:maltose O-acetyltransferase
MKKLIFRHFAHPVISLLPALRFNSFKRLIYNGIGYKIEKGVVISSSAILMGDMNITIKKNTFVGHGTMLIGGGDGDIEIGANCDISSRVNIVSGSHKIDMINLRSAGQGFGKKIVIEDGVWIGFGATVLPGVRIGYKSIIGAGSVVNKDIPPYSIAVGVPAKVIKTLY